MIFKMLLLHSWFCFTEELPDERKIEVKLFCFHMLFTNNFYTKKYILNHTKQDRVRNSLYKLREIWNSTIWQWHSSLPVIKNSRNVSDNNNLILSIWKCLFFFKLLLKILLDSFNQRKMARQRGNGEVLESTFILFFTQPHAHAPNEKQPATLSFLKC